MMGQIVSLQESPSLFHRSFRKPSYQAAFALVQPPFRLRLLTNHLIGALSVPVRRRHHSLTPEMIWRRASIVVHDKNLPKLP